MAFDPQSIRQQYEQLLKADLPFYLHPACRIDNLAALLCLNVTYTSRFVNEELGMSFTQLLRNLRLDYAVRLRQEKPYMALQDLAYAAGFNNETTFRRAYKERYGCNPSEA